MDTTNIKTVIIQVTENCNLNCVYCYQHSKTKHVIKKDLIKEILSNSILKYNNYDEIHFEFFGGEPLLCFDMIKDVAEWMWTRDTNVPYLFFATTNGTLLTEEMKKWFSTNKTRFILGLSLDGTKEMHDLNRCNSFDRIDIDFFKETWPEQGVKMTVSPLTIGSFAEGVIYLQQNGWNVAANLAYGIDWSDERNKQLLANELKKLVDFYLQNQEYTPIMMLDMALHKLSSPIREKYCGTGTGMIAFDINGNEYPCQMFYPVTINPNDRIDFDIKHVHEAFYNNCYHKELFNMCPLCIGINISNSKDKFLCDKNICELMQIFFQANAYYKFQLIEQGRFHTESKEMLENTLNGIKIIQNY